MNIFPIHSYEPKDRPWVIRSLRYMGYLLVIISVIVGVFFLGPGLNVYVASALNLDYNGASMIALILGGLAGLLGGLAITLPYWSLAMLLDDIHAIRVQTAGYASVDGGEKVRQ